MDKEQSLEPSGLVVGESAIVRASAIAAILSKVIEDRHLYHNIEGKKFVQVEGWTTLGALMSVFPEVVKTETVHRQIKRILCKKQKRGKYGMYERFTFIEPDAYSPDDGEIIPKEDGTTIREITETVATSWVALKNMNGQTITTANAVCSSSEEGKLTNPEYSIVSMSQTRATGKAFRLAFSWIMGMGGYEATPLEEVEGILPKSKEATEAGKSKSKHDVAIDFITKASGETRTRAIKRAVDANIISTDEADQLIIE
jgi:uncharacterized protein YndB with AHSA1/START domain